MSIYGFVIRRKVLISMLFLALSLLGIISYNQLRMEIMPDVELPFLLVQVSCSQEVDPEYMEDQAIIPLEGAVGTLEGISSMESSAEQRRGIIRIYFNPEVNLEYAYLKLEQVVGEMAGKIPEEFTARAAKIDFERLINMFMRLQVRGGGGEERIRSVIDKTILKALESIDGVSNVGITGSRQQSLEILLDNEIVDAYEITPANVRSLIGQNTRSKNFVGHAYEKDRHYFVNLVSDYTRINDLENIVVDPVGPVLLRDVADITFGFKEQTTISRVNGKDAVTLQLIKDSRVNLIDLSRTTREVIDRLNRELAPQDIEIVIQSDTAEEMERNLDLIKQLALLGGLLAVLILWFFIRNIRLVLTVLLAVPVSVLVAFNFFYAFGITINPLTLAGLALAIGMLLDNSVVVLENIYRHRTANKDRDTAVTLGTHEVWRSIVASTLTTITVFLPFVFSTDLNIRIIGRHVGVSIISTLLVSLAVALLLVPMIAHAMLGHSRSRDTSIIRVSQKNRLMQIYTLLLKSAMRYPARTVVGAVVAFFLSVGLCLILSMDVPREVELKEFNLYVTMPTGSTLEHTDEVVRELETMMEDIEECRDVITTIYDEGDEATLTVVLDDDYEKIGNRDITQIKELIEEKTRGFRVANVSLTEPASSARFGRGMSSDPAASLDRMFGIGSQSDKIAVKGSDFDLIRKVSDDIEYYLEDMESVRSVRKNLAGNRPEIHMHLDNRLMSYNEVPVSAVSSELASFENEVTSTVKYKQAADEFDIVIRNETFQKEKNFADLLSLQVPATTGAFYELGQLSRIVRSRGLGTVNRINQEKQIELSYGFEQEVTDSKSLLTAARVEVDEMIAALNIPSGVAVEAVRDESELDEFYFLIAAAFILIYMILASVFESLTIPLVMMFTIPLATIGAFWALILTGNSLFMANSMVGFLILLGVVVNNGIILIDYANILRRRGYRRSRALMTAGQARIRPILITAITTIVAMTPLAMGKAEYVTRIGAPFAITVIGGLALSTLFTLVFIPTAYTGLETALDWLKRLNWKVKLVQIISFAVICALIYFNGDSLLWSWIYVTASLVAIPGMTWFVTTSLRRSRADLVEPGQELRIHIRRLVKVYDDYSRFVREWKKGERMERMRGLAGSYRSLKDFSQLVWQLPLLGFIIYFVYFYLSSSCWLFILTHLVYFYALTVWRPVARYLDYRSSQSGRSVSRKAGLLVTKLIFWGFGLFSLTIFHIRGFRLEVLLFIAFLWYACLVIYTTSNILHRKKINLMRLTGRFAGLRRRFYQLVRSIPVIGRKKEPFGALQGVSLEITNGMIGLLGPNGAGKTTLMRVICGVLDQSMGRVKVNNIDSRQKREELQGMIGYLPQEFGTYENMTAYEFLDYIAILKKIYDRAERNRIVDNCLKLVHLEEDKQRRISDFSGGMKQRVGIAMTLLHLPRILVVDEPTAGLDPRERIRFRNLLVELSKERIVIFSTHIIEDVSSSCNKLAVLDKGNLYYEGDPQQLTDSTRGKVWQFSLEPTEFQSLSSSLRIVHHMRAGNRIRVRCLADSKPYPAAEQVLPTLEDAYLWLLGKKGSESPGKSSVVSSPGVDESI